MTRIHWRVACEALEQICKFWRWEKFPAPIRTWNPGTSTSNSSRYTDDTTPAPHTRKDARQKKWSPKTFVCTQHLEFLAAACHCIHCCSPVLTLCRLTRPDIRKLTSPLKTILTVNISPWSQKKEKEREIRSTCVANFLVSGFYLLQNMTPFNFQISCKFAEFFWYCRMWDA